ncbi:hypothetical protein PUR28_18880 [Streptomyces sp. BE308]|uniref:hypothetical protein n=1 Tax=unclassified Streptomyces TaxID=2593676 RepID=UPI002DDB1179|nr:MULTISPECIES: hypothetical protein [unclassified Streptomyces]MEE1792798.1 hypothetical protein [Streptomyces sp. BE308]WRZ70355.1 hypothetical protein OG251_01275 [Streptomyces sp. NBC_01237]
MTVIVGLVHKNRVHLGADSAGVAGLQLTVRRDPKVFRNGPYAMGFTTSFRMGQLLQHAFQPPHPTGDLHRFMVTTWTDALRTCLKDGGYARKDSEQEQAGTFLVGIHGRLYSIWDDYQVAEHADDYAAVGCGDELALGALHATVGLDLAPRARLTAALAAADHHSAGVTGPYTYASTPKRST